MFLIVIAFNCLSVYCTGNELNAEYPSDSIRVTTIPHPATDYRNEVTDIKNFTGSFRANCGNNGKDYLALTVLQKAAGYFAELKKFPANHAVAAGLLIRDTINFLPEANIWSIHDKHNGVYAFAFNKHEEEPCEHKNCPGYITLVSAGDKYIPGDNCFEKGKYIFFINTAAKLNPAPARAIKDRPGQIISLNEDAKPVFERSCLVGKEIVFTKKVKL